MLNVDVIAIGCLLLLSVAAPNAALVGNHGLKRRSAGSFINTGSSGSSIREFISPRVDNHAWHPRPRIISKSASQLHVGGNDIDIVEGEDELLLLNNDGLMLDAVNLTELSLFPDLKPIKDAIDATPPTILQVLPPPVKLNLPESILPYDRCKAYNYDIGHAGRFTVFGAGGASLEPSAIFERNFPLDYIQNYLTYEEEFPSHPDEVVVFSPGLNTLHEPSGRQRTAPMRIGHYSKILEIGIAQLHTGTQLDQGELTIHPVSNDLATLLREKKLFPEENVERLEDIGWEIPANRRDTVQSVLSSRNLLDTPIKKSIKQLLDVAADNVVNGRRNQRQPNLVLMSYSRATIETASALQSWKKEAQTKYNYSKEQVEDLMRKAVTVVTIGCGSRDYPDGPAYIHVSMLQDHLTLGLGAMEGKRGGGRDAVYIHTDSPYATEETTDSHNMGACVAQLLSTAMRLCGTRSFRDLYEQYNSKVKEKNIDVAKITAAMIQATKGTEWLWKPDKSLVGMPALPSEDEARSIIDMAFGPGTYDEIAETNEGGMQEIIDSFQVDTLVSKFGKPDGSADVDIDEVLLDDDDNEDDDITPETLDVSVEGTTDDKQPDAAAVEEDARFKAEEDARLKAEDEAAKLKAEEDARLKAEQDARLKAEEDARLKAEQDARLKAEDEAARRKAEEEAARLNAQEEALLKAAKEAKLKAEEDARIAKEKADEEEARIAKEKAEEEARITKEKEIKAEEEAMLLVEEEAKLKAEEEARLLAEEEAKLKAEEQARLLAEEEAKLKAEEKARLLAEEEAKLKAEEKAKLKAEEEARLLAEQEAKLKTEAEAKFKAEKEARIKDKIVQAEADSKEDDDAPIATDNIDNKKGDSVQDDLAAKYASIDSLEERAYTILLDLGMVGSTNESDSKK